MTQVSDTYIRLWVKIMAELFFLQHEVAQIVMIISMMGRSFEDI